MTMTKLPDPPKNLSDMVYLAVEDVKKLPPYITLDMSVWLQVSNKTGKVCSACFAGATMLGLRPDTKSYIRGGPAWDTVFNALDEIRSLDLLEAMFTVDFYRECDDIKILDLSRQFNSFVKEEGLKPLKNQCSKEETINTMTKVADWLKEKGL